MPLSYASGSSDRVTIGNIQTAPTIFTVCVWFRLTSSNPATQRLVGKGGAPGFININSGLSGSLAPRTVIDYATTDAAATGTNNDIKLNQWTFLVTTFDGSTAPRIYLASLTDPLREVTYTASVAPAGARSAETNTSVYLGNQAAAFNTAPDGVIARVEWHPTVLPLTTIAQIMRGAAVGTPLGRWRLGTNGRGMVLDESGNNFHGTITGAIPTNDYLPRVFQRSRVA